MALPTDGRVEETLATDDGWLGLRSLLVAAAQPEADRCQGASPIEVADMLLRTTVSDLGNWLDGVQEMQETVTG